ncbi:hypothetical protein Pyn_37935 [Prunus yedoensis var. nudiflora]|uniref:CCHC-type domain-containing protein n=1 Tax=Prunus yedoensis var. nudiflora TaxID=2094558 RepID=A0A314U9S3_PRUYE|nr:hypothetical protein Pyn_37935 [Prunus yedoensis var. nudiflora]
MKFCCSIHRWPEDSAVEDIQFNMIPFWVQVRGVPLNLCHMENMTKIGQRLCEVIDFEDPAQARGFLRIRALINSQLPLPTGFWLKRRDGIESWVEFQFERLSDFCFQCGRLGHALKSCTFSPPPEGNAGYGKWTRATIIREYHDPKPENLFKQERRNAGARNPKTVQGLTTRDNEPRREDMREEHAPHLDTRNNGQNLDSRPTGSDTDLQTSPHMGHISSRGLLRTLHLLTGVPPNSNSDQILLLTKDNGQKSPFSLQELNTISDPSWNTARIDSQVPRGGREHMKVQLSKGQTTKEKVARSGPSVEGEYQDLSPLGSSTLMGQQLNTTNSKNTCHVEALLNGMGLKRISHTNEVELGQSPNKKQKGPSLDKTQQEQNDERPQRRNIKPLRYSKHGKAKITDLASVENLTEVLVNQADNWEVAEKQH